MNLNLEEDFYLNFEITYIIFVSYSYVEPELGIGGTVFVRLRCYLRISSKEYGHNF